MNMHLRPILLAVFLAAGTFAAAGLAGCSQPQDVRPAPVLDFAHGAPILLNVRVAEIDSRYRPNIAPPNIERSVSPTPQEAMIKWAQQRLRSDGTENVARFTIVEAPVNAENLPRTGGLTGALTTEPAQRWTVILEAQLEFLDESGARLDGFTAKVARTRDLKEGTTSEERSLFWSEMIAAAMGEFDAQMNSGLRQYAARWLR
jgi:hypothetical protein